MATNNCLKPLKSVDVGLLLSSHAYTMNYIIDLIVFDFSLQSPSPNPNSGQPFLLPPSSDRHSTASNISLGATSEEKTLWDREPLPQRNSGNSLVDTAAAGGRKTEQATDV